MRLRLAEAGVGEHGRGDRPVRGRLREQRGVEVRLRRRVVEPDPRVELRRTDVVGVGAIVAVDDRAGRDRSPACRSGSASAGPPTSGIATLPSITSGAPASRRNRPDAAELVVLGDAHLGGRERAALAQHVDVEVEWRVERGRLREVHRRRGHPLAGERLRHGHDRPARASGRPRRRCGVVSRYAGADEVTVVPRATRRSARSRSRRHPTPGSG